MALAASCCGNLFFQHNKEVTVGRNVDGAKNRAVLEDFREKQKMTSRSMTQET